MKTKIFIQVNIVFRRSEYTSIALTAQHGITILEIKDIAIDPRLKDLIDKDYHMVEENLMWVFNSDNNKFDNIKERLTIFLSIHSTIFSTMPETDDEASTYYRESVNRLVEYLQHIQDQKQ